MFAARWAEAVLSLGAIPVPADSGPDWAVAPEYVRRVISPRTRAVVVAHLYGVFADVEPFRQLGVPILEDYAQALAGGRNGGSRCHGAGRPG